MRVCRGIKKRTYYSHGTREQLSVFSPIHAHLYIQHRTHTNNNNAYVHINVDNPFSRRIKDTRRTLLGRHGPFLTCRTPSEAERYCCGIYIYTTTNPFRVEVDLCRSFDASFSKARGERITKSRRRNASENHRTGEIVDACVFLLHSRSILQLVT